MLSLIGWCVFFGQCRTKIWGKHYCNVNPTQTGTVYEKRYLWKWYDGHTIHCFHNVIWHKTAVASETNPNVFVLYTYNSCFYIMSLIVLEVCNDINVIWFDLKKKAKAHDVNNVRDLSITSCKGGSPIRI